MLLERERRREGEAKNAAGAAVAQRARVENDEVTGGHAALLEFAL